MASRPAKRQRRSTIITSDDEDNHAEASHLPLRHSTRSNITANHTDSLSTPSTPRKRNNKVTSTSTTPKTSPEKLHKVTKSKPDVPNKSLHSFFTKVTDEQRWHKKSATPEVELHDDILDDEIIDDEDYELQGHGRSDGKSTSSQNVTSMRIDRPGSRNTSLQPSSQRRFAKPTKPVQDLKSQVAPSITDIEPVEHKPWADRYGPQSLEELAVHKKKVGDVQHWLESVYSGRQRQRLLVLKGPAGSGKTSTVSLLANSSNIDIVPWHNPTVSETGLASVVQQFGEFLSRGGGFDALSFQDDETKKNTRQVLQRRLLLVEEFPSTMTRSSNVLDAFRSVLLQYLASSNQIAQFGGIASSIEMYPPVIFIISETLLSSSTALTDSFTAHRLLGPELSNHPLVTIVEFNPVAPTFVQKALDLVVKKEARDSKRRRTPGPAVISKIAEIGDIRSAINSLEFLCARGDSQADWSGTVAARTRKKDAVPLTEMEKNTLQLVSQRESTLDMFHAAGKIVYNKREDPRVLDTRAEPPPKPPDHLMHLYSGKVSQVDIDALLAETGTDIQTFISTVHENYVLSCNGDGFVDSLDGCSASLSDSDILNPDSRNIFRSKGNVSNMTGTLQSGNSDMLRQDEISFQTASRGLLFSLPFPVNRAVPNGTRKQDAFKMFYPASLRLWKPREEINDFISMYINQDVDGLNSRSNHDTSTEGVAKWKSRDFGFSSRPAPDPSSIVEDGPAPTAITSRDNHVLEILPFTTMILSARKQDVTSLKKITQFRGVSVSGDEPFDEELDGVPPTTTGVGRTSSTFSTSKLSQKVEAAHNSIKMQQQQQQQYHSHSLGTQSAKSSKNGLKGESNVGEDVTSMAKLYISDDDIQDDSD